MKNGENKQVEAGSFSQNSTDHTQHLTLISNVQSAGVPVKSLTQILNILHWSEKEKYIM